MKLIAEGGFGSLSLLSHCSSSFVSYNIHYLRYTNYRPIIEPLLMFVLCHLKIALRKVSIEQAVVENIFLDVQHYAITVYIVYIFSASKPL